MTHSRLSLQDLAIFSIHYLLSGIAFLVRVFWGESGSYFGGTPSDLILFLARVPYFLFGFPLGYVAFFPGSLREVGAIGIFLPVMLNSFLWTAAFHVLRSRRLQAARSSSSDVDAA
jgi:hypothetical protein